MTVADLIAELERMPPDAYVELMDVEERTSIISEVFLRTDVYVVVR